MSESQGTPIATIETKAISPADLKDAEKKKARKDHREGIEDPHRIIRQGLVVIFLFFGVLGMWATFSEISGAVVGQGKVKIETERKTIQHLEGGIVDEILVREGDTVRAGQPLLLLESIQVDASVDMLRKQLTALLASQARYTAEKDIKTAIVWSDELMSLVEQTRSDDVIANEQKIFSSRRDALDGQVSLLKSQIGQLNAQISGSQEQLKAEEVILGTLEEELKAKRQLYAERYLEKSQILELERQLASHQGNRGRLRQAIAEARQKDAELRLRIEDARNRFVEDASNQLGRLDNEILQTRERIRPLKDAKRRLQVVAPVDGRVVGLKVHSKGGVVRPGEPLLDIVPNDNPLIVEMQVPVNKVTEVFIGQEAQVQLDAFDIRITPLIKAKVSYISADRMEDRTNAGVMPYFMCYVEIDPKGLKDAKVYLSPGMPATVFITTKKKTVLYYMLEPLIKNWSLALRE
ncbi:MAG: HlyD family type I secretion periplasmic adaptor subunit [Bilophila sp.]